MALINIPTNGLWSTIASALNNMFSEIFGRTGFADYADSQYTTGNRFPVLGNVDTLLPNNAGITYDTEKPTDITTFYDGTVITGRDGDGLTFTFEFIAVPTNVGTTEIEIWLDITGGTGTPTNLANLYRRLETFEKGVGVEKTITYSISGYTRNTWEANGGVVKIRTNGTCDIFGVRYVLTRTHKAR